MHNELTKKDIQMMREELDYRRIQLRPQLLEPPSRRKTGTRAASATWRI